jgi:hypothetical protein
VRASGFGAAPGVGAVPDDAQSSCHVIGSVASRGAPRSVVSSEPVRLQPSSVSRIAIGHQPDSGGIDGSIGRFTRTRAHQRSSRWMTVGSRLRVAMAVAWSRPPGSARCSTSSGTGSLQSTDYPSTGPADLQLRYMSQAGPAPASWSKLLPPSASCPSSWATSPGRAGRRRHPDQRAVHCAGRAAVAGSGSANISSVRTICCHSPLTALTRSRPSGVVVSMNPDRRSPGDAQRPPRPARAPAAGRRVP